MEPNGWRGWVADVHQQIADQDPDAAGHRSREREAELAWIDKVRQHFSSGLLAVPVPVSKVNFDTYGASTTPTLVVISSKGVVDLYHPGLMSYDELRSAIDQAFSR